MTLAIRVLVGLVAGFLLGMALGASSSPAAAETIAVISPVGTIFVNLIRMTVIPLIASLLVASIGAMAFRGGFGRTVVRAVVVSLGLFLVTEIATMLVSQPLLARVPIDRDAALALPGAVTPAPTASAPSVGQWLLDMVPPNIVQAAASGAMLPVILFATLFGFAVARVPEDKRRTVLQAAEGVATAMQQVVLWILALAPIGVFALAVTLGSTLGLSGAGSLIAFVVLVSALSVLAMALVLYPFGIVVGRMSPSAFAAYCAPAQAIGFAARSSLAALPAMVQSAERAGLPPQSSRLVLPVAIAIFHYGAAVGQTFSVLFVAHLYGVALTAPQLVTIAFAVLVASVTVPGIPGGSIIALIPVLSAVNLPLEGAAILFAVDTIPDMFRTTANVTGAMTLTAILPAPKDSEMIRV